MSTEARHKVLDGIFKRAGAKILIPRSGRILEVSVLGFPDW